MPVGPGSDDLPASGSGLDALVSGWDVVELLQVLGVGLRALHEASVPDCPYDAGIDALLGRARRRVVEGSVDTDRFDAPYRRSTASELLALATAGRPDDPAELVLVHGGASLSTARVAEGRVVGWAALAHAGTGDAYRDLATMAASLVEVIGPEALGPFVDAYGLDHPEVIRLDWHVLVDQLLR